MTDLSGRRDAPGAPSLATTDSPWGNPGAHEAEPPAASPSADKEEDGPVRNPWRAPPRRRPVLGGDKAAPSLEELLRRGRQRFGGGLPRGGRPIWGYAIAAFVLLWLATTSVHRIGPDQRGIVTRFGRYVETLPPGLGYTLPAPVDVVTPVNVARVRSLEVPRSGGENLALTRDGKLVDLAFTVRWTVRDPARFLFRLADPEQTLRDAAETAMRTGVAQLSLDDLDGSGRADAEAATAAAIQTLLDRYRSGIAIDSVTIRRAAPPDEVADAYKQVAAAHDQAENDIAAAQSYAQQVTANAQASAAAFDKVYQTYKLAPGVTRTRIYYETMEAILAKTDKVIIDAPGASPSIVLPSPGAHKGDAAGQGGTNQGSGGQASGSQSSAGQASAGQAGGSAQP